MNRLFIYVSLFFLAPFFRSSFAQERMEKTTNVYASSLPIQLSTNKTTTLIFPFPIKGVDRGSADVLAQKAVGSDHILQLKGGRGGFEETNLTVLTSDGALYTFQVMYAKAPRELLISLSPNTSAGEGDQKRDVDSTLLLLHKLLQVKGGELIRFKKEQKMLLGLEGVFIGGKTLFLALLLQNKSSFAFPYDSLQFFIVNGKSIRRRAGQNIPIKSRQMLSSGELAPHSSHRVPVALHGVSFSRRKKLLVEWMERGEGRKVVLTIPHSYLNKGRKLPL